MENSPVTIQQLKRQLVAWVATWPNLRAILVVGSQARRDHPADEWSDLDLMVFATDCGTLNVPLYTVIATLYTLLCTDKAGPRPLSGYLPVITTRSRFAF